MKERKPKLTGEFESAAQKMLALLDRAAQDLSRTVNSCLEQLSVYSIGLEESLRDRLEKGKERLQISVETDLYEIDRNKERLTSLIQDWKKEQIETIASAGRSLRESLQAQEEEIQEQIAGCLSETLKLIASILDQPRQAIERHAKDEIREITRACQAGAAEIDSHVLVRESALKSEAEKLEGELKVTIGSWKEKLAGKLRTHERQFSNKAESARQHLSMAADKTLRVLLERSPQRQEAILQAVDLQVSRLDADLTRWQDEVSSLSADFDKLMSEHTQMISSGLRENVALKAEEARAQIDSCSKDSKERLMALNQSLKGSVRRTQQDYRRRLEALTSAFEAGLSESLRRTIASTNLKQRTGSELKDELTARLTAQGLELLRRMQKAALDADSRFRAQAQNVEDSIESLRWAALETIDRQVPELKSEIEKGKRAFQAKIARLKSQTQELEEEGRAAAMTLKAYGSSRLSIDS